MKKTLLSVAVILFSYSLFAQKIKETTARNVSTETVKPGRIEMVGMAEKSVTPDQVIFNLNLKSEDLDFSKAIDHLNQQMETLKNSLQRAGITPDKIHTMNYSVNENYAYESGKRIKKGYVATQSLQIKEDFEEQRLKDIHQALSTSGVDANMRISFGLSDVKKYKDELMVAALFDARAKATLLAQVENSKLGRVINISYGRQGGGYQPRNYEYMEGLQMNKTASVDIKPRDLTLSDQVYVIYEIVPLRND